MPPLAGTKLWASRVTSTPQRPHLCSPLPAAWSAQAPRGQVTAGLLQARVHLHEHLLHLHTHSTCAVRVPALSPRPSPAAHPHFRRFSASASDVQTAPP